MKIGVNLFNYIIAGIGKEELRQLRKEGRSLSKFYKEQEMSIYLYHIQYGKIIKVSTQEKILVKDWDFKNCRVKSSHPDSLYLNNRLDTVVSNYKRILWQELSQNKKLTLEEIKGLMRKSILEDSIKPASYGFYEVFKDFMEYRKTHGVVKKETSKKFITLLAHLKSFSLKSKYPIHFNSINQDFEIQFRNYLAKDVGVVNDTSNKYLDSLKTFMKWALEKNMHANRSFEKFKTKSGEKNDIVTLTEEELNRISELNLSDQPTLEGLRDLFIFLCYTGQRFSDGEKVRWVDINFESKIWNLYQTKGNKSERITVPLHHNILTILNKYKASTISIEDKVFPHIGNVYGNRLLKTICSKAGINSQITKTRYKGKDAVVTGNEKSKLISFHSARRTFITLSLQKGMLPEEIREITGHEDYKTMKTYINISNNDANDSFHKVWK